MVATDPRGTLRLPELKGTLGQKSRCAIASLTAPRYQDRLNTVSFFRFQLRVPDLSGHSDRVGHEVSGDAELRPQGLSGKVSHIFV